MFRGDRYKTSLALFLQVDRAGTLNMILSEFAYAGINLSMIQSRPTKQALGDYMFFIEFKENANDLAVQTASNCLRLKLREVKVLGSYPIIRGPLSSWLEQQDVILSKRRAPCHPERYPSRPRFAGPPCARSDAPMLSSGYLTTSSGPPYPARGRGRPLGRCSA